MAVRMGPQSAWDTPQPRGPLLNARYKENLNPTSTSSRRVTEKRHPPGHEHMSIYQTLYLPTEFSVKCNPLDILLSHTNDKIPNIFPQNTKHTHTSPKRLIPESEHF